MLLRFANVHAGFALFPLLLLVLLYRVLGKKVPVYTFPLMRLMPASMKKSSKLPWYGLMFARLCTLGILGFLVMQPEWVDERTKIKVDGVDMILTIDVSESMYAFDDARDRRPRIEVAKDEAIRFVEKRKHDQMGIVLFATQAISLCPLTPDVLLLKECIAGIQIGAVQAVSTALGTGIATAVNRLRNSKALSKVIILFTDGAPTPPEKVDIETALKLAQALGVKIYTVGIGSPDGGFMPHPLGMQKIADGLNMELLERIAVQTGGKAFRASSPRDMRAVCEQIDKLETTEQQVDLFARYYPALTTFMWLLLACIMLELFLRCFWWRGVVS